MVQGGQSGTNRVSGRLMEYAVRPLATAGFFVLIAFFWTLLLQRIFPYPFVFLFFGAVMGSAWFGGTIAGILSVVLSTLTIDYFFVPPIFSWSVDSTSESYFVAFIVCAAAVSWVSSAKKRTETSIREARDLLEERVRERTAELEQSNLEIQERERRLRIITEAIPQQIWSAGADGRIDYCNHHLLAYVGAPIEEMGGENFLRVIHPEDREAFQQSWKHAVSAGELLEGECRVRGSEGKYRWFLVRSLPQRSSNGEITRWYGTNIDIEDRREAEQALIKVQAELSHLSHKLGMGELAASIAHEINQPLTAVVSHAYACREWLLSNPANLERASFTAEKIVQESTRASAVVARVRALFRQESYAKELLDVNRVIQSLLRLLRDEALHRDVVIRTELAPRLPRVEADRIQLQQVLLNLAVNGMDAMSDVQGVRELLITTRRATGDEIAVQIADCGVGIGADIAAKIFNPFFSTKPDGIGIGLSISRTIIEAHDGQLRMRPRPEGGSIFEFTLPIRT